MAIYQILPIADGEGDRVAVERWCRTVRLEDPSTSFAGPPPQSCALGRIGERYSAATASAATASAIGFVCDSELPKLWRPSAWRPPRPPHTNSTMSLGSGVA
jgi:hypothetical protein